MNDPWWDDDYQSEAKVDAWVRELKEQRDRERQSQRSAPKGKQSPRRKS